jgi:ATP-dependent Clp protease protease subunit
MPAATPAAAPVPVPAQLIAALKQQMAAATPPPQTTTYISFSAEINVKTMEALLGVLAQQCSQGVKTIYLLLSTPGGHVNCGITIYNMLRAMPFHLITHNVGNVDSIGNVIFLAGAERYACAHSTFMFHGVGFDIIQPARFEEKTLRERLGSLDADQNRIGGIIKDRTKLNAQKVKRLFFEAQTKDAAYARANGIVHKVRDVKIPAGSPILQLVFQR